MATVLSDLKEQIERMEGRGRRFISADGPRESPWRLGLEALDAALPEGGLPYDACHDFTPLTKTDLPQAAGFVLALLRRLPRKGPIVWCQTFYNAREYGRLYPPGLVDHMLSPDRFLFVNVPKERDLALVLEECSRVSRIAAVVGEGPSPDFTQSRRLTLATQESRVPCLILNTSGSIGASAAATRWRIAPITGPPDRFDPAGPGGTAWSITLARVRGGDASCNPTLAHSLDVFWNDATHSFDMVSSIRAGAALAHNPADRGIQESGRG